MPHIPITATHCNTLQHTAKHCNILQQTTTHCSTLQHTATHCNTLHHTAPHYNTATHCNTLQHTTTLQHTSTRICTVFSCHLLLMKPPATSCNTCKTQHIWKQACNAQETRQHVPCSGAHCNKLQHTATHCNTLQHKKRKPTTRLQRVFNTTHCNGAVCCSVLRCDAV